MSGSHDLFFTRTVRQSVEKCPHNEIDGSPGGALQVRNASEDTETRGDGRMKSGGRSVAGSNHAPVEIRRPLSARPQLVRAQLVHDVRHGVVLPGGGRFEFLLGTGRRLAPAGVAFPSAWCLYLHHVRPAAGGEASCKGAAAFLDRALEGKDYESF